MVDMCIFGLYLFSDVNCINDSHLVPRLKMVLKVGFEPTLSSRYWIHRPAHSTTQAFQVVCWEACNSDLLAALISISNRPNIFWPLPRQTPQYLSFHQLSSMISRFPVLKSFANKSGLRVENFCSRSSFITPTFCRSQLSIVTKVRPSFLASAPLSPANSIQVRVSRVLQLW